MERKIKEKKVFEHILNFYFLFQIDCISIRLKGSLTIAVNTVIIPHTALRHTTLWEQNRIWNGFVGHHIWVWRGVGQLDPIIWQKSIWIIRSKCTSWTSANSRKMKRRYQTARRTSHGLNISQDIRSWIDWHDFNNQTTSTSVRANRKFYAQTLYGCLSHRFVCFEHCTHYCNLFTLNQYCRCVATECFHRFLFTSDVVFIWKQKCVFLIWFW